jgi:nitroreductase
MGRDVLDAIRTRRVARFYREDPVPEDVLWTILEAARWAPASSNTRVHRFVCITDRLLIGNVRMFSTGMEAVPAALIVVCIDWNLAGYQSQIRKYHEMYWDVGTAVENMLLAAHGLELAAGPMRTSSAAALRILLNLPEGLDPQMMVGVGYPAEPPADFPRWPKLRTRVKDLVQWGPFPESASSSATARGSSRWVQR